ncbi:hypothetical protein BH11MYX4_BH11MYX4_18300 [soil metagenome]
MTTRDSAGPGALAGSAQWLAPELVAFTLPDTLVADGDHRGQVAVSLALPGAYEPRVAQCEGPQRCVLDGDAFVRDVMTHIVYVPLAR